MRVLFVGNSTDYFRSHRLDLARALVARGFWVCAALPIPAPDVLEDVEAAGVTVYPYPYTPAGLGPASELPTVLALWRIYRSVKPHVVHHLTVKPILYGGMVARLTRVPVRINAVLGLGQMFSSPDLGMWTLRTLVWPFFRFAAGGFGSAIIVQNMDDRAFFEKSFRVGMGAPRVYLIPGSGVDPSLYHTLATPEDPPIILFAGRLLKSKGLVEFVEGARLIKPLRPEVRFVICGDVFKGNPSAIDEGTIHSWVEEGIVEWWGRRDDMSSVLARAALVVLPSWYGEGVPRILIEAAAAMRPIITTDSAGCREIVRDGVNGLLVPPHNIHAVASAMGRLIGDPKERMRMGAEGRRIVETEFSLDRVIRETMSIYDDLISDAEK